MERNRLVKRIKVAAVCGAGVATSLLAKMNIEKVAKRLGIEVAVNAIDVGSVAGIDAELYVTTGELVKALRLPASRNARIVVVNNLVKADDIDKALTPVLQELAAARA